GCPLWLSACHVSAAPPHSFPTRRSSYLTMGGRPSRLRVDLASLDGQCQQRRTCQRGHDVKASKRERLRTLAKMHAQNRYALTWLLHMNNALEIGRASCRERE